MINRLVQIVAPWRKEICIGSEIFAAAAAMLFGLILRLGVDDALQSIYLVYIPPFVASVVAVSWMSGLKNRSWRFFSLSDLFLILRVATISVAIFVALLFALRSDVLPRTEPLIAWFILVALLGAPRIVYRALLDGSIMRVLKLASKEQCEPILIYGFNSATEHLIRLVNSEQISGLRVVGIIDDAPEHANERIRDVGVLGPSRNLRKICQSLSNTGLTVKRLFLIGKSQPAEILQSLVQNALEASLRVERLQTLETSFVGSALDLTAVPLDLSELLGRQTRDLNLGPSRELIHGETVVVTGGGGSIGSELCQQIVKLGARRLVIIDHSEFNLYAIEMALRDVAGSTSVRPYLVSINDRDTLFRIFSRERPAFVFNAAAYKHVPLVEQNPLAAIITNVLGTRNVADAAAFVKTRLFVQTSTDKAVNSTNVMGLTKRCAEIYCQSRDRLEEGTRFMTVRFGNVLGSSGSVVPLFQSQIAKGGPVDVTHEKIRRYFMTIPEAAQLVIMAAQYGLSHSESRGRIHVLDMGESIRILDLAKNMIRLAGYLPDLEIPIRFVGLRPGEKIYEELFDDSEQRISTTASGILEAVSNPMPNDVVLAKFSKIEAACQRGDEESGLRLLVAIAAMSRGTRVIPADEAALSALRFSPSAGIAAVLR
jgi:FlaA1/EpsC-like NDP-sugar epimerase